MYKMYMLRKTKFLIIFKVPKTSKVKNLAVLAKATLNVWCLECLEAGVCNNELLLNTKNSLKIEIDLLSRIFYSMPFF